MSIGPSNADNRMIPEFEAAAPVVSWEEFSRFYQWNWRQSEHVAMIGPTGAGKTTLALWTLDIRQFVVAFATKPRDPSLDRLRRHGYHLMREWRPVDPDIRSRVLLWPDATKLNAAPKQREQFYKALDHIYVEGGWCVYIDELWFIINHLKLEHTIKTYLMQSRSNDVSLVLLTQRPSRVPLEVYDQSTHLFFWRDTDEVNLRRLGGIAGADSTIVRYLVSRLRRYEVLYINTRDSRLVRFTPPAEIARIGASRKAS